MSEDLEQRIRSHRYAAHPAVHQYLSQQRLNQTSGAIDRIDLTVRERRASGISIRSGENLANEWTDGTDSPDAHERCLTPAPEITNAYCCICIAPAINPFRCARTNELLNSGTNGIDLSPDYGEIYHICCYQCISTDMLYKRTGRVLCPICRTNEFDINGLIAANDRTVREAEQYVIPCPNNCGLMGSPLALANHICALTNPGQIGHTQHSNVLNKLRHEFAYLADQNTKLTADLKHVLDNYNKRKNYSLEWESKYNALNRLYVSQVNNLVIRLQISDYNCFRLRHDIDVEVRAMAALREEREVTVRRCKSKLKLVAKHYKTKVQELTEDKDRVMTELAELLNNLELGAGSRRLSAHNDWSQTDEPSLGFANMFRDNNLTTAENASQTDGSGDEPTL